MALSSISSLLVKCLPLSSSSKSKLPSSLQSRKPISMVCQIYPQRDQTQGEQEDCLEKKHIGKISEPKRWQKLVSTTLAAVAVISFSSGMPSIAELNKYEADTLGEFGIGSAAQFGSADLRKAVHVNENFSVDLL